MIVCPSCDFIFVNCEAKAYNCLCKDYPVKVDGFVSWAPELARMNDGFSAENFKKLFDLEQNSFWFRSRNKLILWTLNKYSPNFNSFLEIGCGTGFVLKAIADNFKDASLTGSEIYTIALTYAAQRLPESNLIQLDARRLPYIEEFDVIGAFDVIEHIAEDLKVLRNIHEALKPNGLCLLTVPQHQWLWSEIDVEARHQRRYTASDLQAKLKLTGFQIVKSTSFVSLLLPLLVLIRLLSKLKKNSTASSGLGLSPTVDKALAAVMLIERVFIKLGVKFPMGGSRLVVARKICR
jgi:SAM-dependent methyltransferase